MRCSATSGAMFAQPGRGAALRPRRRRPPSVAPSRIAFAALHRYSPRRFPDLFERMRAFHQRRGRGPRRGHPNGAACDHSSYTHRAQARAAGTSSSSSSPSSSFSSSCGSSSSVRQQKRVKGSPGDWSRACAAATRSSPPAAFVGKIAKVRRTTPEIEVESRGGRARSNHPRHGHRRALEDRAGVSWTSRRRSGTAARRPLARGPRATEKKVRSGMLRIKTSTTHRPSWWRSPSASCWRCRTC